MLVVHEQQDILKKLNYSAIRSNKLFMAEIDVTNRCNCHCFFCFQGNEHKDLEKTLSFDRIISLFCRRASHTHQHGGADLLPTEGFCSSDCRSHQETPLDLPQ